MTDSWSSEAHSTLVGFSEVDSSTFSVNIFSTFSVELSLSTSLMSSTSGLTTSLMSSASLTSSTSLMSISLIASSSDLTISSASRIPELTAFSIFLKLYLKKYYVHRNFTGLTNVLKKWKEDSYVGRQFKIRIRIAL